MCVLSFLKTSDSTVSEPPPSSEEPKPKKPKLSIHISTKKRKQHKEHKVEEFAASTAGAAENNESQKKAEQKVEKVSLKRANDVASSQSPATEADESAKMDLLPASAESKSADVDSAIAADTSPQSTEDGNKVGVDDKPAIRVGHISPSAHLEEGGASAPDAGKSYSMARSGRKAAKRAAEKISAEKKIKSSKKLEKLAEKMMEKQQQQQQQQQQEQEDHHQQQSKNKTKKAEEDPWVQCDRCHKVRLPLLVSLCSLFPFEMHG